MTLYTVHGAGHTIPNPTKNGLRIVVGRTDHTINAAAEISGFFGIGGADQQQ
ncbi:hypothetical protein [Streptomyces sp. NPDC101149]|uniref:hypothetical protein n=1 Tax=Streptomyces sp. NPDC101149 TaxID=3366113 RepID=UPI00380E9706